MIEFTNLQKDVCCLCKRYKDVYVLKAKITRTTSSYIVVAKDNQNQRYKLCADCIQKSTTELYKNLIIPQQAIFDAKMKKAFKKINISTRDPKYKKRKIKQKK